VLCRLRRIQFFARPAVTMSTASPKTELGSVREVQTAWAPLASGSDHIAVLTDGAQDPGLAVLINSLVRNGFDGTLWVGWRSNGSDLFSDLPREVTDQVTLRLVELHTSRPLTYYKAEFLETAWRLAQSSATSISYMDCDMILGCDWEFVRAWVMGGVALVEDLPHRSVGVDHPLRRAWKSVMTAAGIAPARDEGRYFNAGFIGIPESCRSILLPWRALGLALEGLPGLRDHDPHFVRGVRATGCAIDVADDVLAVMRPYFLEDQDSLNMAVMATTVPVCAMGPDAMGFTSSRTPILLHCLGADKPYSTHYIRRLVRRGAGPSFAEDMWWRYSDGPIRVTRGAGYVRRRWSWRIAKTLSRWV
jgi:hypothetical protein